MNSTNSCWLIGQHHIQAHELLQLISSQLDETIRDLDWKNKLVGKAKADDHRGEKPSTVEEGGQVLLRNIKEQGKLASKYESSPYTVTGKEGTKLTLKSQTGDKYMRNSSYVRPYHERNMVDVTEQQGLDQDQTGTEEQGLNREPTEKPPTSSIPGSPSVSTPVKTRTCRVTKRPAKLSNFVAKIK